MRTGIPPFFFGVSHLRKNHFVVNQGLERACLEALFCGKNLHQSLHFFLDDGHVLCFPALLSRDNFILTNWDVNCYKMSLAF
jgi:hypothetical protein